MAIFGKGGFEGWMRSIIFFAGESQYGFFFCKMVVNVSVLSWTTVARLMHQYWLRLYMFRGRVIYIGFVHVLV